MAALASTLAGHLSEHEVRFLGLCAMTLPPELGEVLEIGCFKGKSTTLLAKSVALAGGHRVVAVDPLNFPSVTDPEHSQPENLPAEFRATLEANGIQDRVEFHQMTSQALAPNWDRPLRLLWIDGDHTYAGAMSDVELFAKHLATGAIIAIHDVLHGCDGPIRAFCERVLLSDEFGPCGVCGSIGWAQRVDPKTARKFATQKLRLYTRLSRLIPFVALHRTPGEVGPRTYKLFKALVPHGGVDPVAWQNEIRQHLEHGN